MEDVNIYNYYKMNVDIHINWLLFLNSFRSISNKVFLEVASKLEMIRQMLYASPNILSYDTREINAIIVNDICNLLVKNGLEETTSYVGSYLSEEDFLKYTQATYIRKRILESSDFFKNDYYFYDILRKINMEDNLEIGDFSSNLLSYFLESIRIKMNSKVSISEYNAIITTLLQSLYKYKGYEDRVEIMESMLHEFIENGYIEDVQNIVKIIPNITKTLKIV